MQTVACRREWNDLLEILMTILDNAITQGRPATSVPARLEKPLYAIAFDMDIESLRANYGDPYNNAYVEIRKVLLRHGFTWQQGSVYFGGDRINAVTCVLAAMDVSAQLPWFSASVRDIRMLRIEELNDLMPAVQQAAGGH
jgi:virulence-associated protein VapD